MGCPNVLNGGITPRSVNKQTYAREHGIWLIFLYYVLYGKVRRALARD